ncbi:hypothetical protein NEHOM01_1895 [Nematocida homosporus]|uniref:uncharacterized protein n=1 Tax=Nematocida homosporus TaxID=1912981 RepID=UPI0022206F30|nr:uncharacterized protein NEHOM01_1895 [Nematocida homosporus]KAI5187056.1 hypothetical protein NEHOM01_1895 [Nematocida homosporus]
MFYAVEVLAKGGKLAAAWIAAHFDRRLTKSDLQSVSIAETVDDIQKGRVPVLALRTSSHILLGLSKILFRKTKILYEECHTIASHLSKTEVSKSATPVYKEADRAKITHEIRIDNFIGGFYPTTTNHSINANHSFAANHSFSDLELPRTSQVARASLGFTNLDYSFSLNDISLDTAVTFHRDELESDVQIINQGSTSLNTLNNLSSISQGPPADMHSAQNLPVDNSIPPTDQANLPSSIVDNLSISNNSLTTHPNPSTLIEAEVSTPLKRKQATPELIKKPKLDTQISITNNNLTLAQNIAKAFQPTQPTHRFDLPVPKEIQEFFFYPAQTQTQASSRLSIEIPRRTSLSAIEPIPHHPHTSFENSLDQISLQAISPEDSLLVQPNTNSIHLQPELPSNLSAHPEPADLSCNNLSHTTTQPNPNLTLPITSLTTTISDPNSLPRDKAEAFFSLLFQITTGTCSATQSSPYSSIIITPSMPISVAS